MRFGVKTQAGFAMQSAAFETELWDRDLSFRHNGNPISYATTAMNRIELSFSWNGGTAGYRYTNVAIDLSSVVAPMDREIVTLTPAGAGVFTGTFTKAAGAAKTPMNGILEYAQSGDTVVAVFWNSENPQLPLDTLRVALPLTDAVSAAPFAHRSVADGVTVTGGGVLRYFLAKGGRMTCSVYDIRGRLIDRASAATLPAGSYSLVLSKGPLSPGHYLIDFRAGENRIRKRVAIGE